MQRKKSVTLYLPYTLSVSSHFHTILAPFEQKTLEKNQVCWFLFGKEIDIERGDGVPMEKVWKVYLTFCKHFFILSDSKIFSTHWSSHELYNRNYIRHICKDDYQPNKKFLIPSNLCELA